MNSEFIFKILECKEWFNKEEEYKGSLIDAKDGFIHLSTKTRYMKHARNIFLEEKI